MTAPEQPGRLPGDAELAEAQRINRAMDAAGPSLADLARQLTDARDQARPAPPSADWVRLAEAVLREVAAGAHVEGTEGGEQA